MIYKVFYHENKIITPKRETTKSLYIDADTEVEARSLVDNKTEYALEFVKGLSESQLEYEKQNSNFKITEL